MLHAALPQARYLNDYVRVHDRQWLHLRPDDPTRRAPLSIAPAPGERVWCVRNRNGTLVTRRGGKVAILGNCPEVASVVMLRPTQSSTLYQQMAGRGARPAPGKEDLVLLDVVDNCRRHSLITAPVLLGLPAELDLEGNSLLGAAGLVDQLGAGADVLGRGCEVTYTQLATRLEKWEIFGRETLPAEVAAATELAWAPLPYGFYLSGGPKREARLRQDMLGVCVLELADAGGKTQQALGTDLTSALRLADGLLLQRWRDARGLILAASHWRQQPASEKQRAFLKKQGLPPHLLATLTKGEAQSAIARVLGR